MHSTLLLHAAIRTPTGKHRHTFVTLIGGASVHNQVGHMSGTIPVKCTHTFAARSDAALRGMRTTVATALARGYTDWVW